jgi:hypothetical protein
MPALDKTGETGIVAVLKPGVFPQPAGFRLFEAAAKALPQTMPPPREKNGLCAWDSVEKNGKPMHGRNVYEAILEIFRDYAGCDRGFWRPVFHFSQAERERAGTKRRAQHSPGRKLSGA